MAFRVAGLDGALSFLSRLLSDGTTTVQGVEIFPGQWIPVGPPEKLTVGVGAVVGLTPPTGATIALLFVETNSIRYYDNGTSPTTGGAGNGAPVAAGGALEISLNSFSNFKMIGLSATATVHVLYYKVG